MAKNRTKKKRKDHGVASMDISEQATFSSAVQPMDTSESARTDNKASAAASLNRKAKKGRPMKRSKNVRRMKAVEKAISLNEKIAAKVTKNESKSVRTQSAKTLYD